MTDTIEAVTADEVVDQRQLAEQLLAQAKAQGVDLVGLGGLLNQITKRVLETALEAEIGPERREFPQRRPDQDGVDGDRSCADRRAHGHRRLVRSADHPQAATPAHVGRSDRVVADCKGFDHRRDLRALREVYGASISRDTISKITDKVVEEMTEWFNRPWTGSIR
jgi:putative transposase